MPKNEWKRGQVKGFSSYSFRPPSLLPIFRHSFIPTWHLQKSGDLVKARKHWPLWLGRYCLFGQSDKIPLIWSIRFFVNPTTIFTKCGADCHFLCWTDCHFFMNLKPKLPNIPVFVKLFCDFQFLDFSLRFMCRYRLYYFYFLLPKNKYFSKFFQVFFKFPTYPFCLCLPKSWYVIWHFCFVVFKWKSYWQNSS